MTIGILQLELAIPGAMSLKDKRQAIRSVKDRIANGFNVSIAETDAQDEHRRCVFGVAMVGTGRAYVEGALAKIVDFVREAPQVTITDFRVDFV
jgi:hypothetical protein